MMNDSILVVAEASEGFPDYEFPLMSNYSFESGREPFNAAGMREILKGANLTLDAIFPHYDQYVGYALDLDNLLNLDGEGIKKLVSENRGPLAYAIVWTLLGVLVTLIGLGWCFIRCCCKNGCCSRLSPEEIMARKIQKKRDKCKRGFCSVLFALLVILFTFGLVCCYVTNEQMRINVNKFPSRVDTALTDAQTYRNASIDQINTLLVKNYEKLEIILGDSLLRSGEYIKEGLSQRTGAQALNNLTDIVDTVENVWRSLKEVESTSRNLTINAERLETGLEGIREDILTLLDQCEEPKCLEVKNNREIQSLRLENNFRNLPNMTEILRELGTFFAEDVRRSIDNGRRSLDRLSIEIKAKVEPYIPSIMNIIKQTKGDLMRAAKDLEDALNSVPIEGAREDVGRYEEELKKYSPYWYYAMLLVCGALTFIFALMAFGIFVGFCGKQPGSEYSNECCSRKTGSSFINCGIFFIFVTFLPFVIVALIHFIVAGVGGQIVCEAINNLDNQTEAALRLPKIDVKNSRNYEVPAYGDILRNCREGRGAYTSFHLISAYDTEEIRTLADRFKDQARSLAARVNLPPGSTDHINFLTPETKETIERFSRSKISTLQFQKFAEQLSEHITSVDLNHVIERVRALANDPEAESLGARVRSRLLNNIMFLENLQSGVLVPMMRDVNRSVEHLRTLAREQKDLAQRVKSIAQAAEIAQDALHRAGASNEIRLVAQDFSEDLILQVEYYANFTYERISNDVGRCDPLFNAFNSTVSSVCVNVIMPFGGFWLAISALLLLFIPILITGCSLSGLYSKYKSGGYESVNSYVHSATYYSSAGYGDGDTIPLSLNPPNARRHKRPGTRNNVDQGHRYSNRFDDASHKAWGSQMVFNNHHTPPASGEYERPPPYYYPGPAQQ